MSFGGASIAMCLRLSALVGKELEELLLRETARHVGALKKRIGERALGVVQAQDLLGLGSEARMNEPSTVGRNWQWRALPGVFTEELAQKIHRMMVLYERVN